VSYIPKPVLLAATAAGTANAATRSDAIAQASAATVAVSGSANAPPSRGLISTSTSAATWQPLFKDVTLSPDGTIAHIGGASGDALLVSGWEGTTLTPHKTRFYNNLSLDHSVAPRSQMAGISGVSTVTNSITLGGTTGTSEALPGSTYSANATTIRNNLYQLARAAQQDYDTMVLHGLLSV